MVLLESWLMLVTLMGGSESNGNFPFVLAAPQL